MGTTAAFCLLMLCGIIQQQDASNLLNIIPRKTVKYQSENLKVFKKQGLSNFSTVLLSEETNTLYAGVKDYILVFDLNDISKEISRISWFASEDSKLQCLRKGKSKVIDNMKLKLYTRATESRGRCPYEPTVSYASLIVDGALYTATSNNFLGTEPIILRSFRNPLRTEYKATWLNEPTFIHMELIQENEAISDSDRIYVFFTETATEFEFYDKLRVSRVAQLCKGDLGGKRTLKKRWTSFLKSTLLCSVPELQFQFNILQDVFVVKNSNWRETIIYGIFTQQWGKLDISAVCAFQMETIQEIFLKGSFKGPVALEGSHMKWVMYRGDVPTPRPGACADVSAVHLGYNSSLDLPDKVLQFARDHPLMDSIVNSVGLQPVFLKRGTKYTQLVISQATDLDNVTYDIFFLGTDKGYLHKTLNCHGEIIILEEIQLFPSAEPVQILKLASLKGLLYASSPSQLVQLPVAICSWYKQCFHCILARDPYCAWSLSLHNCILLAKHLENSQDLIQSIRNGDIHRCPEVEKKIKRYPITLGSSPHLNCEPLSNTANLLWMFNKSQLLEEEAKYLIHTKGLVVFNATVADTGLYECQSVEKVNGRTFRVTMAVYLLQPQPEKTFYSPKCDLSNQMCSEIAGSKSKPLAGPETENPRKLLSRRIQSSLFSLIIVGSTVGFLFLLLLSWNIYKGYISLPWASISKTSADESASPEMSLEQIDLTQTSSTSQTMTLSTGKSSPLMSSSKVDSSINMKPSINSSKICSSSNCLVMDETKIPDNDHEIQDCSKGSSTLL
ncbi:semaphorin-4E-like isoform X2 [Pantherophis guttatus]|uniref:Semaphorin-4E-like isoform X2 n=1 Tax=Pantherophis guttatus TaxID=94885 RepID=A0A6P9C2F5_PANGU|nr:semaphorin-4E-like isoform X2 [Pantherophis guttatus]